MDGVIDIIRMQLMNNQGQLVQNGKIAWKTVFLMYLLTNHRVLTSRIQDGLMSLATNLPLYKKHITFERKPTGVVYLQMETKQSNVIFKEMLSRHALDFGSIRMQNTDEFYAKGATTIKLDKDIYFELYFRETSPENKDKNDTSKKPENKPENVVKDVELYENSRGRVYSYSKSVAELVQYLQNTYQIDEEKPEPEKKEISIDRMPNLSNLTVIRLTSIENNVLKGEKQDFVVSKNLDNIFLETALHEKLVNHIDRFDDKIWYATRGIPRTLGILLHGIPGCGKTSFIKGLCSAKKRSAVIIDFKLIKTVHHLRSIFTGSIELKNGSNYKFDKNKVVYVLEDFDCMSDIFMDREKLEENKKEKKKIEEKAIAAMVKFHSKSKAKGKMGKKGKAKKLPSKKADSSDDESDEIGSDDEAVAAVTKFEMSKSEKHQDYLDKMREKFYNKEGDITLGDFLELLDGIIEMDGRIIIMTTNCRDKIDKALLRPGRIDLDMELKPPSLLLICEIFFYMYQDTEKEKLCKLWKQYHEKMSNRELPTAKVMNCFMYMDPEQGLEHLVACTMQHREAEDKKNEFDNESLNNEITTKEQLSVDEIIEISTNNVEERLKKVMCNAAENLISLYGMPKDIRTHLKEINLYDNITVSSSDFISCKNLTQILNPNNYSPIENLWTFDDGPGNTWVCLNLPVKCIPATVAMKTSSERKYFISNWTIQGSNDMEHFTEIMTVAVEKFSDIEPIELGCNTFYKQLRFVVNETAVLETNIKTAHVKLTFNYISIEAYFE